MCHFHDDFSCFFSIYKNREVARCFHGYRNYAPHSDITRYQKLCTIPSSSRICIQIPLAYPALPNWHFQILPLYYYKCLHMLGLLQLSMTKTSLANPGCDKYRNEKEFYLTCHYRNNSFLQFNDISPFCFF